MRGHTLSLRGPPTLKTVSDGNELGAFLRARRELVRPEDVGLPTGGTRRVPGLRREEVSALAGISAEYYLRLEQGRDRRPSPQVLDALARVLQLDAEGSAYLYELSRDQPARSAPLPDAASAMELQPMLDAIATPAFVVDKYREVLAANEYAIRLSPLMRPGVNRVLAIFLDPVAQTYHPDWKTHAASLAGQLRADIGTATDDVRAQTLIGELSLKSPYFRELWARHDVARGGHELTSVHHPEVGALTLRQEKLRLEAQPDLVLVMYLAEPGTESARRLAVLERRVAAVTRLDR